MIRFPIPQQGRDEYRQRGTASTSPDQFRYVLLCNIPFPTVIGHSADPSQCTFPCCVAVVYPTQNGFSAISNIEPV